MLEPSLVLGGVRTHFQLLAAMWSINAPIDPVKNKSKAVLVWAKAQEVQMIW